MDPLSIVADEVALEGLDGITLPTLWIRLEDRKPKFPLKLDDCTKELLWKSLISNSDLQFYELPQERGDVELFDRFKDINPETGIETAQKFSDTRKDVYPVHIVQNNTDGIQGSCVFFEKRKDVTKFVQSKTLTPLIPLQEALERYGRKLVVVASQPLRFRALIGNESDPDLTLTNESYCVLERVGRARWQGELQKDLHGSSFKIDARKLHYMRKSLVRHGLVSMQSYVTRTKSGQQLHSILLLLKRFHINRRSKYDILMENVSNFLEGMPGQLAALYTVREHLTINERTYKRIYQYMKAAKLIELRMCPLEDLDPGKGPCINKNGKKVQVRCIRLLKPYKKKGVPDEDDEEDDDEDNDTGGRKRALSAEGRIMEMDILTQAYQMVLSSGTIGIAKSAIGHKMNIGKLESRMICRNLERAGMVKSFMVDEGRQRTTKYISHKYVGVSNQLQLFAKEQERCKMLTSPGPQKAHSATATPKPPTPRARENKGSARKRSRKTGKGRNKDSQELEQICAAAETEPADEGLDGETGNATERKNDQAQSEVPVMESTTAEDATPNSIKPPAADSESTSREEPRQAEEEEGESRSQPTSVLPQSEESNSACTSGENNIEVVKDAYELEAPSCITWSKRALDRSHETYRMLRRKNLIVEAIHNLKVMEGTFPIQKMINEKEKEEGNNSKCCKKTILRLIHSLSREGLLKIYKTTVIQDGITKNIQMFVHPSVAPNDDVVNRVIDQVRFRISSSYQASRLQEAEEKARQQQKDKKKLYEDDFKPETVRGLGKSLGFQPKMHRLRVIHNFLWYLIYGHPLKQDASGSDSVSQTAENTEVQPSESTASGSADSQTADSSSSKLDDASGDEDEEQERSDPGSSQSKITVYADEESWKRFMPPVRLRKDYSSGWAMVGDLLLCLPLSVFIQVIQINYKVEGLEEYLSDPVKQHHLVRMLPATIRRQLLYKRKYIFLFFESLQRLVYMGLLHFGPIEKFKDKDQVFLYLKRHATIVDTTSAEPHYWLVTESPDKPFERRQYTFNTTADVENYWFDLMCVCLNTPLGVIRIKKNAANEETSPSFVHDRYVFVGLSYLLKGSREVCDDGSIPGDAKGAGGLHSEFFSHLKRNWLWTNHLLSVRTAPSGLEAKETKIRLNSLLSRSALRIALKAGGSTSPRCLTNKKIITVENVEVGVEPASRNKQVVGGKSQKRKRSKKEVVKPPRKKKKEPKKRLPAHDEADHRALKMMTRQRVLWSVQEDSLMMLCSVASHLFNSTLRRPFVSHCVVRDMLHTEYEMSADKTSLAVGRRSRYILKNPQTLLNYRICLAEVYEDKPLIKLLEENKPSDPDSPEDCAAAFSKYVKLLREKFSSSLSAREVSLPDTKFELFSRCKVSAIESRKQVPAKDTLSCTGDIHATVLHNLIQSTLAMTNNQMKSSRSFQTFHMYSKFDQELLCQVFIQCRKRGLVNRRRVNQPFGPKKNRALPILPMSYQLSQSYYRCFSWRFPHSLCTDSFRFLRSLVANKVGDDKPFVIFYQETVNRSAHGEYVLEKKTGTERKRKTSDEGAASRPANEPEKAAGCSTEEGEKDQIKEEEDTLTEVCDKATNTTSTVVEEKKEEDSSPAESAEQPSSKEQTDDHQTEDAPSNSSPEASEEPDVSEMVPFPLDSPGGSCVVSISLMSLGLLAVHLSIPKQMVVVDSTMVENDAKSLAALDEEDDDDEDGEECEGGKKMEVKAHQASHTKYLMMKGYCSPGIVKIRRLNTTDNIVLESCNVRLQLRSTPAHNVFINEVTDSPQLNLLKYGPSLVPSSLTQSIHSSFTPSPSDVIDCENHLTEQKGYTPQDIEACAQIRQSLNEAGENGVDVQDLHQTHLHLREPQGGRTRSLQQYMKDLQEEGQVVRVGSLGLRWVLMQHAEPWLLTLNSKQWYQSQATSDKLTVLQRQHNFPFMRKRCRRGTRREKEEPPAKTLATERQEGEDKEEVEVVSSDVTGDQMNEGEQIENQKEIADEENGEEVLNEEEEGGKEIQPEEKGEEDVGQEKMDAEEKLEKRRRVRSRRVSLNEEKDEGDGTKEGAAAAYDDNENISFVSRPWRMVDGTLNRTVCKGMLEGILYHIMYRPGLTQRSLVEHYKDLLQPVAVVDLVEGLISMGCVTKRTLVRSPKPSLFSSSVPKTKSDSQVETENPDSVFYEPTISCCLRLAQVFPNERHWNLCLP